MVSSTKRRRGKGGRAAKEKHEKKSTERKAIERRKKTKYNLCYTHKIQKTPLVTIGPSRGRLERD